MGGRYKISERDLESPAYQYHSPWGDTSPTLVKTPKPASRSEDDFKEDDFKSESPTPVFVGLFVEQAKKSQLIVPTPTATPVIKPISSKDLNISKLEL